MCPGSLASAVLSVRRIKIQESRMRENLTYGLTRGKGETDSILRSFSYSTNSPVPVFLRRRCEQDYRHDGGQSYLELVDATTGQVVSSFGILDLGRALMGLLPE